MNWNWKLSIMRVLVNGIAIYITAFIVPGIYIFEGSLQERLLGIVVIGGVFGLLNALIRPVIQFVALPLLFISLGFVVIAINIAMLFILNIVLPNLLRIEGVISLILGGIVMGLLGMILDGLLGLTPPLIDDKPEPEREEILPSHSLSEMVSSASDLEELARAVQMSVPQKESAAVPQKAEKAVEEVLAERSSSIDEVEELTQ